MFHFHVSVFLAPTSNNPNGMSTQTLTQIAGVHALKQTHVGMLKGTTVNLSAAGFHPAVPRTGFLLPPVGLRAKLKAEERMEEFCDSSRAGWGCNMKVVSEPQSADAPRIPA